MILFVVTDALARYRESNAWHQTRNTLEDVAQDVCLMMHYRQVNLEILRHLAPWAVCYSGGNTPYEDYDILTNTAWLQVLREWDGPQIGFCRGSQVLAHAFGCRIGPIRRLEPHEPDPAVYAPGYFKEWGFCPVEISHNDPLFDGCPATIRVQEAHFWEVKELTPDLVLLARSRDCGIQAYRHRHKTLYGVQFHPEQSSVAYPDGTRILANFFRLARAVKEKPSLAPVIDRDRRQSPDSTSAKPRSVAP